MKQMIRALGWAIAIFWAILLLFTATAVYSALQSLPRFGQGPSVTNIGSTFVVSVPLGIYNGGFYDITKFNITTQIQDNLGTPIAQSSTFVPLIPKGENTTIEHRISFSISQVASSSLTYLLFNDTNLNLKAILGLTYANAFPIRISANLTAPWGAPMANLTLGDVTITGLNITHIRASIPFSFENRSFLGLNGTTRIEIIDNARNIIGGTVVNFDAPPKNRFERNVEILTTGNPANIREARLYFQTPYFNYGPMVFPLV